MQIIQPSYEILPPPGMAAFPHGDEFLEFIERAGRTCYKSEDRITQGRPGAVEAAGRCVRGGGEAGDMSASHVHVRVETRKVYVSARGARLTKHAAYIHAARHLIAEACDCHDSGTCFPDRDCSCGVTVCRFHRRSEVVYTSPEDAEGGTLDYYIKVRNRLVPFLKFVDRRAVATAAPETD